MSKFYEYFKENMESLGLTAPDSLFGSQQTAVGTITTILAATDKFGSKVTIQELIGAGTKMDSVAIGCCRFSSRCQASTTKEHRHANITSIGHSDEGRIVTARDSHCSLRGRMGVLALPGG